MQWQNDRPIVDKRPISSGTIEWWAAIVTMFRDPAYNVRIGAAICSTYSYYYALLGHCMRIGEG